MLQSLSAEIGLLRNLVQQALGRIPSGGGDVASLKTYLATVGANVHEGNSPATIDGSGNALCSSDPFTLTNAGNSVDVEGTMFVLGDQSVSGVDFQLFRDATPLGGPIITPTGNGDGSTCTLRIFDAPGDTAPHVYRMKGTHRDGVAFTEGSWQFVLAERVVVVP